ncbi:hypothetical protein RM704_26235 [Streptomyces sp. DSM 3412]|uniref:Uncharacterized protein n=1 Tax=Streptomyces gottesmaniae TaxID=3075518 RepID=A0ABU2Z666_9ACTN|nr:hypothetical protein [Streptomyces sp. DSM 3412]MDT0570917.1 hypothetical protein [Streptomyces sp. DSM 3412]
MGDYYELQLSLDLPASLPVEDLTLLRWHLGEEGDDRHGDDGDGGGQGAYEYPLLAERGAAWRVGGALVGELCGRERGWALTVRQEVHPDQFDDLRRLVGWLGARTSTAGVVGHVRFYEEWLPDLLIVEAGVVSRMTPSAGLQADGIFEIL